MQVRVHPIEKYVSPGGVTTPSSHSGGLRVAWWCTLSVSLMADEVAIASEGPLGYELERTQPVESILLDPTGSGYSVSALC